MDGIKQKRTTSAGYRLPLEKTSFVYRAVTRPEIATQTGTGFKKSKEIERVDEVSFNKIWREQIINEWKGVHDWTRNWGFLKNYDPRGRPKTAKNLPEKISVYGDKVSPTQGHVYGSRVSTPLGIKMNEMEFVFHSSNRKCRMGSEFICY